MNYLAHIFLSHDIAQRQVGNFIGDFVKGSRYEEFPAEIRRGILVHRRIDSYTDAHPVVRQLVESMRPHFGRYAAIVLDLYFDYFLASDFRNYSVRVTLKRFALRFYAAAVWNYRYLPERVKGFIWHFISTDRLSKYGSISGLRESLEIMQRHKIPALDPHAVILYLNNHHSELEEQFRLFFPDLIEFVEELEHQPL